MENTSKEIKKPVQNLSLLGNGCKGIREGLWQEEGFVFFSQQLSAPNGTSGLRAVVQGDWVSQIPT